MLSNPAASFEPSLLKLFTNSFACELSLNFVIEPYRVYFVLHWLNWESCETYGSKKLSNFEIWTALNQFESIWIYFNHLEAFGSDSLESVKLNRSVERRAGESFKFKVWESFWLQAIAQSPGKSIKCINLKNSSWSVSINWTSVTEVYRQTEVYRIFSNLEVSTVTTQWTGDRFLTDR